MTTRKEILKQATDAVCTDREGQYGSPEDNFRRIADLWTAYWGGYPFEPKDVAMMMSLLKIARTATGKHKDDNYIDLAGYAACGAELGSLEPREPDTLPEDCSLDGLEIVVHIVGDEVTDCGGLEAESDKEYIKKLSQTVSQLTEELEKEKEFCKIYKSEYNHLKTNIDTLKDKNHSLRCGNNQLINDCNKLNEEIDKLKQEIETRNSIHNDRMNEAAKLIEEKDDEITKLRTERDILKDTCEHFMGENKELKKIRDDLVSEVRNEREAKETALIEMKKCQADRDYYLGKCIDFETRLEQALGKDVK